ncbi:hypothetical protein [Deinococcus sp. YIM 77859]|uniref:hypothetical protein n=1 Tax=Deinococcus sp. YIM 77859 TaxID=1540221 RepID=UPI000557D4E6|nr:hypothetical protein [Deinococcus sp. YIM 77859]
MHLVSLLLPLYDNTGQPFEPAQYAWIRQTLTERFGGLTAYTRAPAAGLWRDEGQTIRDDVVVYEVLVEELDRSWWAAYREELRLAFQQDELMVRAQAVELL